MSRCTVRRGPAQASGDDAAADGSRVRPDQSAA